NMVMTTGVAGLLSTCTCLSGAASEGVGQDRHPGASVLPPLGSRATAARPHRTGGLYETVGATDRGHSSRTPLESRRVNVGCQGAESCAYFGSTTLFKEGRTCSRCTAGERRAC